MLRGNYRLGSVVTYRYTSPTAHDRIPLVFLLTSRHRDGMLHGVNLRYMSQIEQMQLQYYFTPPEQRAGEIDPFQQQSTIQQQVQKQREQQAAEVERKKQEAAEQREGYVVRPQPGNIFGVSTFTRTKDAIVQKAKAAYGILSRYVPFGGAKKPPPLPTKQLPQSFWKSKQQPKPPATLSPTVQPPAPPPPPVLPPNPHLDDPYHFYYNYVKPTFGSRTRNFYRTYKHEFIQNERIVRSIK